MIVTGAAGVLGASVCAIAEEQGAEVVLLDVVEKPESIASDYHQVDLLDGQAVGNCFKQIGRFDCLANIAGGFDMGPTVWESTDDLWEFWHAPGIAAGAGGGARQRGLRRHGRGG